MLNNNEGTHSEYFDELCALAAGGQISEVDFIELRDHLQNCAECRSSYGDFVDLLHNRLPLSDPELLGSSKTAGLLSGSSSYRDRFLTRARKEGFNVSDETLREMSAGKFGSWLFPKLNYVQAAAAAVVLLIAIAGIFGYAWRQSNVRNKALAADLAAMDRQIHQQPGPVLGPVRESRKDDLSQPLAAANKLSVVLPSGIEDDAALVQARQDYAAEAAHAKELDEHLQAIDVQLQDMRAQYKESSDSNTQLAAKLKEVEQARDGFGGELLKIRDNLSKDASTIDAQSRKIQELTVNLERETTLLAAGRDINDLMTASNLHVVTAFDVDSKGKKSRAVARYFYTEGKSLLAFGFGLGDLAAAKRNVSFQAWGNGGPGQTAPRSLGIFYIDDQTQNRWKLEVTNPAILAEIDSVFVTVEPSGGSLKPTNEMHLYAPHLKD